MNSQSYVLDEIPIEVEKSFDNKKSVGLQTPKIEPKLDDTIPSLLNLYSEISKYKKTYKNDSFNLDNLKFNDKAYPLNNIISLFKKSNNFIPSHLKAFSNENLSSPKIFNFFGINQEEEKINDFIDNDYKNKNEINFEGEYLDFCEDNNNDENEEFKKIIFIDNFEEINKKEDEEENEDYIILNFLQKRKNKN